MNLDHFDPNNSNDEYTDVEDMREGMRADLRQIFAKDDENNLFRQLLRRLRDPVQPEDKRGRWRPHPLLLLCGVLLLVAVAIFLYVTFTN